MVSIFTGDERKERRRVSRIWRNLAQRGGSNAQNFSQSMLHQHHNHHRYYHGHPYHCSSTPLSSQPTSLQSNDIFYSSMRRAFDDAVATAGTSWWQHNCPRKYVTTMVHPPTPTPMIQQQNELDLYRAIATAAHTTHPSNECLQYIKGLMDSKPKTTKLSFAQSAIPYHDIHTHNASNLLRDRLLLNDIMRNKLPKKFTQQEWKTIASDWELQIKNVFGVQHTKCSIIFLPMNIDLELKPSKQITDNDIIPPDTDLDATMIKEGTNMVLVHNDYQVLFASLNHDLCSRIHGTLANKLSINTIPNGRVIDGVKQFTEHDASQKAMNKGRISLSCANFGVTSRSQKGKTSYLTMTREMKSRHSFDYYGARLYYNHFYPAFFQSDLSKEDRLYNKNGSTKGGRPPRVDINARLDQRKQLPIPIVMKATTPMINDGINKLLSSCYESSIRRLSEEIMGYVFSPLPYAMTGFIGSMNENQFLSTQHILGHHETQFSRPFPRGSLGTNLHKSLHDDKNGIFSFTCWQNLQEDKSNGVRLSLRVKQYRWSIRASTGRFCVLNGMIAHKTNVVGEESPSNGVRLHHSSYWKTDNEQFALVALSDFCK